MTVNEIHAAVVVAYREALEDSEFENVKIVPIDRETQDEKRFQCETEYDATHSREIGLKVTTVTEELYYFARDPKKWKIELNNFQELMELRLLRGVGELEVNEINCESGRYGDTGGVLHITFNVVDYEEVEFDGRNANAEFMEDVEAELEIHEV